MPRTARASAVSVSYHVLNRGNNWARAFDKDDGSRLQSLIAMAVFLRSWFVTGPMSWQQVGPSRPPLPPGSDSNPPGASTTVVRDARCISA